MFWLVLNAIGSGSLALAAPVNAWAHRKYGETGQAWAWVLISLGSAAACVGYVMRIVGAGR